MSPPTKSLHIVSKTKNFSTSETEHCGVPELPLDPSPEEPLPPSPPPPSPPRFENIGKSDGERSFNTSLDGSRGFALVRGFARMARVRERVVRSMLESFMVGIFVVDHFYVYEVAGRICFSSCF
jgi:hypothetical protein